LPPPASITFASHAERAPLSTVGKPTRRACWSRARPATEKSVQAPSERTLPIAPTFLPTEAAARSQASLAESFAAGGAAASPVALEEA
jgi:hypothetical protein